MTQDVITLYAVPHSLYSARARTYLIKMGIPYREVSTRDAYVYETVKPKAGGHITIPMIEFGDGSVIRDGAAIIDHFEAQSGMGFSPDGPKQNVISRLFDVIGAEGFMRPAMHYRWSFDTEQLDFLKFHFRIHARRGPDIEQYTEKTMHKMGQVFGPSFGVSPETASTIEALYLDQLNALETHFSQHGYLLGGRPCIGDFGMIGPLHPHLGRDPVPLAIMLEKARSVFRWTERMNRMASDLCEFEDQDENWLPNDEIPPTLVSVMHAMAEDFVPETLAAADCINQWLDGQNDLPSGTKCDRGVGMGRFMLRGIEIDALAQPYRFYLLKRFQDAYNELPSKERAEMDAILADAKMTPLLDARLSREIGRKDNLEVWL